MSTRERMTWKTASGPTLPIESAQRRASGHPAYPDEGVTHPAGYDDPAADAYKSGDPSSWAEDPHKGPVRTSPAPANPMDDGGYRHPATQPGAPGKNAAAIELAAQKKAAKCIHVASALLGKNATVDMVEDQALEFMSLPDMHLAATLRRLDASTLDEDTLLRKMLAAEDGEDGEEDAEDPDSEEGAPKEKEASSNKLAEDKLSEVMSMLASLSEQVASMKGGGRVAEEPVVAEDADEALLASMLAAEEEEAHVAVAEEAAPAPVAAPKSAEPMVDDLDMEMGLDMGYDDAMGLEGDMALTEDDELLNSLYAESEPKLASKKAEEDEEVVEESEESEESEKAKKEARLRPQAKKASTGARSLGNVRVASANPSDELSKLWDSAPDVSDVFRR